MSRCLLFLFSFFFLLFSTRSSFGAACCGGGGSQSPLISNDDQTQVSIGYSSSDVVVDNVDQNGYWRRFKNHQSIQTVKAQAATLLSDRLQLGVSIPIIKRERLGVSHSGLGDVAVSVGYEFLPEWDYHVYRPKGFGFFSLTLPTGYSRYESNEAGLDSRGNGFWAVSAGALLTKTISDFDGFLIFDLHRSFSKRVKTDVFTGRAEPGFGTNLGLGLGYNFNEWRAGSSITWTAEDKVNLQSDEGIRVDGAVEKYATASLSASYLANESWSGTLSYTDQTWFGSPVNTSLARGVALQVQRRFSR